MYIHPFSKCLLSAYNTAGTVLEAGKTAGTKQILSLHGVHVPGARKQTLYE